MTSERRAIALNAACSKIGSGATPRGGKESYKGGRTALIRSQNVYNEGFVRGGLVYISDEQASELRNVIVEPGDVLLNITGDSVARCCIVDSSILPARVNQHVAIVRAERDVLDARYLRYLLVQPLMQAHLLSLASAGATRNALTKGMLESLVIEVPPLPEQRAIAHVLGTLDDKIELNRKMSETLEELARTLFKSWFVDFDPVHAKAAGKKPFGMDDATAALFPDSFEDSELGPIPRGWRVAALGELTSMLTRGRAPSYSDEGLLILNQKCIRNGRVSFDKARRTEADSGRWDDRALAVGDVLVNSTGVGTLGRVAQVTWLPEPASFDTHVTALRAADNVDPTFFGVGQLMKERVYEALGEGSTGQTELSRGRIAAELVVVPPEIVQRRFGEVVGPFRERSSQTERESLTLAELRDTLLPKLLSGELRVPLDVTHAPTSKSEQLGLFGDH